MENIKQNKAFIINYFNAISGEVKIKPLLEKFVSDEKLIDHILFFDGAFPKYELIIEEMLAEDNKVIVRGHATGIHQKEFNGIPPTNNKMELPFVIRYTIKNHKISDHWLIADQAILMRQLGVLEKCPGVS